MRAACLGAAATAALCVVPLTEVPAAPACHLLMGMMGLFVGRAFGAAVDAAPRGPGVLYALDVGGGLPAAFLVGPFLLPIHGAAAAALPAAVACVAAAGPRLRDASVARP